MDVLEIGLEDSQLLDEIQLVTELMIAAGEASGPMDQTRIDELLGVAPQPPPVVAQARRQVDPAADSVASG